MACDSDSKNGSKTEGEEEEIQIQEGVEVPIVPDKFNWTEYHLFIAKSVDPQINTYTEENDKTFKNIEAVHTLHHSY